jgi:hypothetical protein
MGRDTVTYYALEWNSSGSTWVVLNTNVTTLLTSYTHQYGGIFPSGSTQTYRVKAMNGVGYSSASPTVSCVCDTAPTGMTTVTAGTVNPTNITISWTDMNSSTSINGGDNVFFYSVEWSTNNSTWTVLNSLLSGYYLTYMHAPGSIFPSG